MQGKISIHQEIEIFQQYSFLTCFKLISLPVFSARRDFASQETPDNVWLSEHQSWGVLLAFSGQRPGIPLSIF
jgi:hypothetical protein